MKTKPYNIYVKGIGESAFSGSRPADIAPLATPKTPDDTRKLMLEIAQEQIKLCLQAGDTTGAWEVLEKFSSKQAKQFNVAELVFQADSQNGNTPFIGAHCVFGAFRDAIKFLHDPFYHKKSPKNTKYPSEKHFRKSIQVRPAHIFLKDGKKIITRDRIIVEGQQPVIGESRKVDGFSQYETINLPFWFEFTMTIFPEGKFEYLLKDEKKVVNAMHQATRHGLLGRRGVGYGMWKIEELKIK